MRFINQFVGWILRSSYDFMSGLNPEDSGVFSNYAIAIILMSVIIKVITSPLMIKSQKSMAKQRALQPKLKEIEAKYGNDTQTIARKQQELLQKEGINMMGGCLPLLIQMPILFAMFTVVRQPEMYVFKEPGLYESINKAFFWITNLNDPDKFMILPIASGVMQYVSSTLMSKNQAPVSTGDKEKDAAMEQSNRTMRMMMPLFFVFMYRALPAVLPLYMLISMGLSTIQQLIINKLLLAEEGEK